MRMNDGFRLDNRAMEIMGISYASRTNCLDFYRGGVDYDLPVKGFFSQVVAVVVTAAILVAVAEYRLPVSGVAPLPAVPACDDVDDGEVVLVKLLLSLFREVTRQKKGEKTFE